MPDSQTKASLQLTVLMPCRNEEECLEHCIKQAFELISLTKLPGEVLVADNASSDNSSNVARQCGARVVYVSEQGYGNTLRAGIENAYGEYIVMADADGSYDFTEGVALVSLLENGAQLAIGNRFAGGIKKGAMPLSHRIIGNPVLSFIGRVISGSNVRDFHCGLRAVKRDDFVKLSLKSSGMEFASEMVIEAALADYEIGQAPVTLSCDLRSGEPHLRSIPDGIRHLRYMFSTIPRAIVHRTSRKKEPRI